MTDQARTPTAELQDLLARMESASAAFVAAALQRSQEWARQRIERYVAANYPLTLSLEPERLAAFRAATDQLVDDEIPAGIASMLARRDDIWMHRRPDPGRQGAIEYDGGERLPPRIANAISAALGRVDRLLEAYGYLAPGTAVPPGFDPTPRMKRALLAYAALQPELAELLARAHAARRVRLEAAAAQRDATRDVTGREAALRRWAEAGEASRR
jgi:hypothetical protein